MISSETYKLAEDFGLITTSYHEAGHALSAICNYYNVTSIEVTGKSGFVHHDRFANYDKLLNKKLLKKVCMMDLEISYAGIRAEQILYKNLTGRTKLPRFLSTPSSNDHTYASRLIRKYKIASAGVPTQQLKFKIKEKVDGFLNSNWALVTDLSHYLYSHKFINSIKLKELILSNSSNYFFWKQKYSNIEKLYSGNLTEKEMLKIIGDR